MVFWLEGATALRGFPEAEPLPSSQYSLCMTGGSGLLGPSFLGATALTGGLQAISRDVLDDLELLYTNR